MTRCNDPLNISGEGFNCDREFRHPLPHMSKLAQAIWCDDDTDEREHGRYLVADVRECLAGSQPREGAGA